MLKILQFLHIKPIYVVIFYIFLKTSFKANFSLKCIQRLFITNVATRHDNGVTIDKPWIRFFRSSRTKVYSFQFSSFTVDRDQTVSQRSKLRSCTAFLGEQPNPWNQLQLQDAIIQHRGAKPPRR